MREAPRASDGGASVRSGSEAPTVSETAPLGAQWPTIDPFLFCAHHDDAYPAGDARMGPAASLAGRDLGMDFAGVDGWNMYHGSVVPGFPQHPHRGFETVTIVRTGIIDHSDSLGAAARFGRGDVQWVTAGRGIVHSEMFPLLDESGPNPLELFQIWLNLPAVDKMTEPYFTMLWDHDIPRVSTDGVEVSVIAGRLGDVDAPPPPPSSWASRPEADVAIWLLHLDPGTRWTMPAAAGTRTIRTLYCFEGSGLAVDGTGVATDTAARIEAHRDVVLAAGPTEVQCLLLQGRAIGEPVERYGPFVMNTRDQLEQAFTDYRATGFGGWPWPRDDPVQPRAQGRFARHADGRIETIG